jgi:ATP-dependent DNA helicase DinG
MEGRSVHVAEAPTGSGKSLAYLAPAMWRAAVLGERTVVTTATLSLQAQVVGKDAPVVAEAVFALTGRRPRVAVLKGWSNYGCPLAAGAVAQEESSLFGGDADRAALADWVLAQAASGGTGDRAACPLPNAAAQWAAVSMSPAECLGDRCPKRSACLPARAREEAAEAGIVVTNHAMVAVQAATSISLLLGDDASFGPFDHVVVDEAHALVPSVRAAAGARVSATSVARAGKALARAPLDGMGKALAGRAETLSGAFSAALAGILGRAKAKELTPAEVARAVEPVMSWAASAARCLPKPWDLAKPAQQVAASRAAARLGHLREALASAVGTGDGMARWVEPGQAGPALCVSPVDVSGALAMNLWGAGEATAVLVSATVPAGIAIEAGLGKAEVARYPSPFEATYQRCRLYVPEMPRALAGPDGRLDLGRHLEWAASQVVALVSANAGSALVLAATTEAAQRYGAALRGASEGWAVHVTGDAPAQALVDAWRADTSSVLVGTRGFMEGVDAPGATCSLVVVDRVPRAAPNPVDDARVAAVATRLRCDRWVADGLVYVADAALLLEQAAGRLVRHEADSGLLAVLDPRLRRGPGGYRGKAAAAYAGALRRFPPALSSLDAATRTLRAEKDQHAPPCHIPEAAPLAAGARGTAAALPLAR